MAEKIYSGPDGVIQPRPLEQVLVYPVFSLVYRILCAIAIRLRFATAQRLAETAIGALIRPFRSIRLGTMSRFLGTARAPTTHVSYLDRQYVRYQGRMFCENLWLLSDHADDLFQRVHLRGEDHLRAAHTAGRGVLIACSHVGNWLLAPTLLSRLGFPVAVIAYKIPIAAAESHMTQIWARYDIAVSHPGRNSVRATRRAIDQNKVVIFAFDASVRPGDSSWMPFGDIAIMADPGPARLAQLMKCPILRLRVNPLPDGSTELILRPDKTEAGDDLMDTWLDELHDEVTSRPEIWWPWSFVRLGEATSINRQRKARYAAREAV